MVKKSFVELSAADKCQIRDALEIRRDAWQHALDVENGATKYELGMFDPDLTSAEEAKDIIKHYNELLAKFDSLPTGSVKISF